MIKIKFSARLKWPPLIISVLRPFAS